MNLRQIITRLYGMFCRQTVDLGPLIEPHSWKVLENMKAVSFAVSGTRKVACVVSCLVFLSEHL